MPSKAKRSKWVYALGEILQSSCKTTKNGPVPKTIANLANYLLQIHSHSPPHHWIYPTAMQIGEENCFFVDILCGDVSVCGQTDSAVFRFRI